MKPPVAVLIAGRVVGLSVVAAALALALIARRHPPASIAPPRAVAIPAPVVAPVPVPVDCEEPLPPPPEVPPFDRDAPISAEAAGMIDEAMSYLARDESDDHTLDQLVEAVTAAPGSARARYGLACALNRRGDELAAAEQIEQLRIDDCPACDDALANLATDLGCEWNDTRRSSAVPPSPQRRATLLIADAIATHDAALAAAHFHRRVAYDSVCSVCDEGDGDVARTTPGPRFLRELVARQANADDGGDGWIVLGSRFFCEEGCCSHDVGFLSHSHSFVTKICFADAQVVSFSEIDGG